MQRMRMRGSIGSFPISTGSVMSASPGRAEGRRGGRNRAIAPPISVNGRPGSLLITSHPDDEMAEIWDGIVTQIEVGSAIAIVLFLITIMVVSRALAPIETLSEAMTRIESGHYDTRVTPD